MKSLQNRLNKVIDLEALNYRRNEMSELELAERRYCALRVAEYLETNFLTLVAPNQANEDEFGL